MATAVEEQNKGIVQRWIDEVFNGRRFDKVDELKTSSYVDWTPLPSRYQDVTLPVSGIKQSLPELLKGLPDFRFASDRLIAEGDMVVCLGHWEGHHQRTYKGHLPTGRRAGGTRIDIFRVTGDKMVEHWGCGNELAFLQLVGALRGDENQTEAAGDIVRAFVESLLNNRDLAAVARLVDPQAVAHSGYALSLLALLTGFPDVTVAVDETQLRGDEVVAVTTVEGTHTGPFMGVAPTGKRVRAVRVDHFRFHGGRISAIRRGSDDLALLGQLGVQPDEHWPDRQSQVVGGKGLDLKALASRFVQEVLNGRNHLAADRYVSGDLTEHLTGSLTAYLALSAFADYRLDIEELVSEEDIVTVLATFTGSHSHQLMGVLPSGRGVSGRIALTLRICSGKIDASWCEVEPWGLLQQVDCPALAP